MGIAVFGFSQAERIDQIVAIVAGHVIMKSDVRAVIDLQLADVVSNVESEETALTYLIERRLVLDEVDRYAVLNPPEERIGQRLDQVAAAFRSNDAFNAALARVGFTYDDLRQVLQDDTRRDAYIENRFGAVALPSDGELREYYDAHLNEFSDHDRQLSFTGARPLILQRLVFENRAVMVQEWVASLVRRGRVVRVPLGR